jgi:hypothetical protein
VYFDPDGRYLENVAMATAGIEHLYPYEPHLLVDLLPPVRDEEVRERDRMVMGTRMQRHQDQIAQDQITPRPFPHGEPSARFHVSDIVQHLQAVQPATIVVVYTSASLSLTSLNPAEPLSDTTLLLGEYPGGLRMASLSLPHSILSLMPAPPCTDPRNGLVLLPH